MHRRLLLALLPLLAACSGTAALRERVMPATAHERYARSLEDAGLAQSALGRAWSAAAARALANPRAVALPFREAGYFASDEASAVAYRVSARRGQRLRVRVETQGAAAPPATIGDSSTVAAPAARLFVDLFEQPADSTRPLRHLSDSDSAVALLDTEVGEGVSYVVRVQPELLQGVRYVITLESSASLAFPVEGRDSRAVQSFWGAVRDGGARDHQGIDIFAPRGTPVLASTDGVVRNIGVTNLGGKVVWLSDSRARQSLYYAHLDSQTVQGGERVRVGDTLGFVGNTGNARTTAPHLHFGIYRRGEGAVNPFPFVDEPRARPPALTRDTAWLGRAMRTAAATVTLRAGPAAGAAAGAAVPRHTALVVDGAAGSWLRVRLPDATSGYVPASAVEPASAPVRRERVAARSPILDRPVAGAVVIDTVGDESTSVPVLGRYGDYVLVEAPGGRRGWIVTGDAGG